MPKRSEPSISDPIKTKWVSSYEEYQAFLKSLDYPGTLAHSVFSTHHPDGGVDIHWRECKLE